MKLLFLIVLFLSITGNNLIQASDIRIRYDISKGYKLTEAQISTINTGVGLIADIYQTALDLSLPENCELKINLIRKYKHFSKYNKKISKDKRGSLS